MPGAAGRMRGRGRPRRPAGRPKSRRAERPLATRPGGLPLVAFRPCDYSRNRAGRRGQPASGARPAGSALVLAGVAEGGVPGVLHPAAAGFPAGGDTRRGQDRVGADGGCRVAGPPGDRLDHCGHPDGAPQAPVGAIRALPGHRPGPVVPELPGPRIRRLHRRGGDLCPGGRAPGTAPAAHPEPAHAGHLRRDPPRRGRAVLGRGGPGGLRAGPAAAGADRHAVPQRHQPDPVRDVRPGHRRQQAQRVGLCLRVRPRAGRRRGPAGHLPGLLRRDALADPGRGRDHRHPGHPDAARPAGPGLADRAEPRGRMGAAGPGGRGQAAHRGPPRHARRGRPGHRHRPRVRPGLRGPAAQAHREAAGGRAL